MEKYGIPVSGYALYPSWLEISQADSSRRSRIRGLETPPAEVRCKNEGDFCGSGFLAAKDDADFCSLKPSA